MTQRIFFMQMIRRVFECSGNTLRTAVSAVKQPSGFFKIDIFRTIRCFTLWFECNSGTWPPFLKHQRNNNLDALVLDQEEDVRITQESLNHTQPLGQTECGSVVVLPNPHPCRNRNGKRWKTTVNGEEYYLPEVRHGGRKRALWGDVSRVARVMVHLGEREQSVTQCLGGEEKKTSIKASIWKEEWEQETFASAVRLPSVSFIDSVSLNSSFVFLSSLSSLLSSRSDYFLMGLITLNWNINKTAHYYW